MKKLILLLLLTGCANDVRHCIENKAYYELTTNDPSTVWDYTFNEILLKEEIVCVDNL